MQHAINLAEVLQGACSCAQHVFVNRDIKFNHFGWGVEFARSSLGDGKTSTCTSHENCGALTLCQLGNPEGQRSIGKYPCDDYLFAIQYSHAVNGSCWGVFVAGSLNENWNHWWYRACR
jgi:hypothetical protein